MLLIFSSTIYGNRGLQGITAGEGLLGMTILSEGVDIKDKLVIYLQQWNYSELTQAVTLLSVYLSATL